MSKIDEICKYLDAKFSSDGKIQSSCLSTEQACRPSF